MLYLSIVDDFFSESTLSLFPTYQPIMIIYAIYKNKRYNYPDYDTVFCQYSMLRHLGLSRSIRKAFHHHNHHTAEN